MDLGDASLFPEAASVMFDEQTLNSPPEPVAASTVHRPASAHTRRQHQVDQRRVLAPINNIQNIQVQGQRPDPNDFLDPRGSFLENHQWSLPESPREELSVKKGPVTYMSFSDHIPPSDVHWDNKQNYPPHDFPNLHHDRETTPATPDRSSLGILPVHLLTDISFGVGDGPSADLLRFGEESGRVSSQQTDQSNMGTFNKQSSASSTDNSKNLWMGDSSNGRQIMATVKRPAALGACAFTASENEEDPEPSICEVQFGAAELQDLDDEFSDLSVEDGEVQDYYSPVYSEFQGGIEDEGYPNEGPLRHDTDPSGDTEEELEAVRAAMRKSLGDNRQHGVGSSQETDQEGTDHFPDFQTRHSAEGEVVSPYPDDFSGGLSGDPISESMRFESERYIGDSPAQEESCIVDENKTQDQDNPATRTVDASRLDSMYLKPGLVNVGRDSEMPQEGYGRVDDSSWHFYENITQSPHMACMEPRQEAVGFSPSQFEGQNPFGDDTSFCPQFNNSLGSFGASPEAELPELANQCPGIFDEQQSVLAENSPVFQDVSTVAPVSNPSKDSTKKYISDSSPVYLDANGVGVTDLAYQHSFVDEAVYQQEALKHLQVNSQGEELWPEGFPEDDFMTMENALDMLNEDEEKFQAENIFIKNSTSIDFDLQTVGWELPGALGAKEHQKDDKMDTETSGPEDESWILKNSMYLSNSMMQTDLMRHGDTCLRISIGQFMRSRSAALGSLGGNANEDRPSFGSEIITPPSNRPPVKLLNDGEDKENSPSTRLEAVGFDSKDVEQPVTDEGPLTMEDITKSNSPPVLSVLSGYTPKETTSEDASEVARLSEMSEVSLSDRTGVLSLSAITDLVASAPENCSSIVDKLLALSKAKALDKKSGKNTCKGPQGSDTQHNNPATTGASVKTKTQTSKLPVRRRSNNSPKSTETSGKPQENQSSKLRDQIRSNSSTTSSSNRTPPVGSTPSTTNRTPPVGSTPSTSCRTPPVGSTPNTSNRTPPVGSTQSNYAPDRTVTLTKPLGKDTNKPRAYGPDSQKCQSLPTVYPKLAGASGESPEWGTARHSIGEMIGIKKHVQNQGQEAITSPVDVLTSSSKTSNQKPDSPRLSEIANNMCIDLSKIEPNPDLTLSDSLAVPMAAEKNLAPAEGDRVDFHRDCKKTAPAEGNRVDFHRDCKKTAPAEGNRVDFHRDCKKPAKTGHVEGHVFKKPQSMPTRKVQATKTNPGVCSSGASAVHRTDKPTQNTASKLTGHQARTKTVTNKGPNKDNRLNSSKPGIPDKVIGVNKNKSSSRVPDTSGNSRKSASNTCKQIKPVEMREDNITTQSSDANPLQGIETVSSVEGTRPKVFSPTPTNSYNVDSRKQPSLEDPRFTDPALYSEIKTHNAPSNIECFHPASQSFPTSQEHCTTNTDPTNNAKPFPVQNITGPGLLPVSEYSSFMPSDGQNLLSPQNFTARPRLIENLVTPARPLSLDGNSMLSFDHGQPAYHSTPFYHALSPCDNSVSNPVSPDEFDNTIETQAPRLAEGVGRLKLLVLPTTHMFEEICCVGVSTKTTLLVKNLSEHWVRCTLDVHQLSMNGQACVLNVPFMFDRSTILEPLSTGSITVIFAPIHKGLYAGQLAVHGCPMSHDTRLQAAYSMPEYVTIEAVAETPNIQIHSENYLSLMFGDVHRGSSKSLPITLINNGRCTVPLRLTITATNSSWHCFTFEGTSQGETILNLTLPAWNPEQRADAVPKTLNVFCNPPTSKFSQASSTCSLPVDIIHAKLDIVVDNPSIKYPVKAISLQAVVGEVILRVPTDLEPIELISGGQRADTTFSIKNTGNLKMEVTLMTLEFMSDFLVTPNSITVEPGKRQNIQVAFCPRSRKPLLQTTLFMKIEPSGPQYEVKLIGKYVPETEQAEILCSKHYVAFGGVEMGKTSCQRLGLLHHSPNRLKLKLEIRCKEPVVFQIKSGTNEAESLSSIIEVNVSPHEEFPVYLVFNPKTLKQFKGKLLIKQDGCTVKFSIPLTGYGGCKQLVLDDDCEDSRGRAYFRKINTDLPSFSSQQQFITVLNLGTRAAFVKVLSFSDPISKVVESNVAICSVSPDFFVIKAGSSQVLSLRPNPHSRQFTSSSLKGSLIGVLKFYYGDEVSRVLYRRSTCKSVNLPPNHPLFSVDFNAHAVWEESIEPGAELFESSRSDGDQFYKSICRFSLSLFGCPKPVLDTVSEPTSLVTTQPHRIVTNPANRNRLIGLSPPVTSDELSRYPKPDMLTQQFAGRRLAGGLSPVNPLPATSTQRTSHPASTPPVAALQAVPLSALTSHTQEKLEIYPRQLILDINSNGGSEGHVLISNMSEDQISFELYWPSGKITIDKDSGKIPARRTCTLTLFPSLQLLTEDISLPWSGVVIIDAQSERKEVSVLIRRGKEETVLSNVPSKPSPNNTVPAKKASTSLPNSGAKAKTSGVKTNPAPTIRSSSFDRLMSTSVQRRSLQKTASDPSLSTKLRSQTSSQPLVSHPPLSQPLSRTNSQPKVSHPPTTANEKVIFTASHIGQATERTLCLSNSTDQPVIWTLSPFTPAYLKVPQSGEVHRIGYDVFKCSRMSGDLQPHETIQIFVQFEPQDIGCFSQFLEVRKREDGESSNQSIEKVQLLAEGLPASSPRVASLQDQYNLDTTASSASTHVSKPQSTTTCTSSVICLLCDYLSFSVWNPQKTERKKAQIKNRDNVLHRIEVIPPQPPFFVSHSSLKIRESHYVKLPIDFCPTENGTFEGIVILKPDFGPSLSLRLKGMCGK